MERGKSQAEPSQRHKSCMGVLYYSQMRLDKGKAPVRGTIARQMLDCCGTKLVALETASWSEVGLRRLSDVDLGYRNSALERWVQGGRRYAEAPCNAWCLQVCAGFSRRLKQEEGQVQLPADSVPGGEFK